MTRLSRWTACLAAVLTLLTVVVARPLAAATAAEGLQVALSLYEAGKWDEALAAATAFAASYPDLAVDAGRLSARCYYSKRDYPNATGALKAVAQKLSVADAKDDRRTLAVWYTEIPSYEDAQAELRVFATDYPAEACWAHNMSAVCYRAEKKYPQAFAALEAAIATARLPADAGRLKDARRSLGIWRTETQEYDTARSAFASFAQDYPDEVVWAYNMVGNCYRSQKGYSLAIGAIEAAIKAATLPRDAVPLKEARRAQTLWLAEMGDDARALEAYRTFAQAYPTEANTANLQAALCQSHLGRYGDAEATLRNVIAAEPTGPAGKDAYWWLANALRQQRRFDEALAVLDRLHGFGDRAAVALSFRGEILLKDKHDIDAAIAVHKQFIAEFPDHPWIAESRQSLAVILQLSGRNAEATQFVTSPSPGLPQAP